MTQLVYTKKKLDYLVFVLFGFIIVLYFVNAVLQVTYSTNGIVIAKIQEDIDQLKRENSKMRMEIAEYQSLRIIKAEAYSMGFRDVIDSDYYYIR